MVISFHSAQNNKENPGTNTPWLVVVRRVAAPHVIQRSVQPQHSSAWERLWALLRTFLVFVTETAIPRTVWIMHHSSEQHLTSCSSKLPEEHKSSSVYLHLKRWITLTSSKRSQSRHRLLVPPSGFTKTFTQSLTGAEKRGWGPHFSESGAEFSCFFFLRWAPSKTSSRGGGGEGGCLRSKASKFLASGPNQLRGPRRGGETSASLLNWSHWDPQGSPRRTHRKAIKIWPCGSDEELGGEKAEKKDCFGGKKQKEQRGNGVGVGGYETDQGEMRETRRVGSFSEGASRHHCAPAKSQSREDGCYQLSNPRYMSDDVLSQSATSTSLFCPGPGS